MSLPSCEVMQSALVMLLFPSSHHMAAWLCAYSAGVLSCRKQNSKQQRQQQLQGGSSSSWSSSGACGRCAALHPPAPEPRYRYRPAHIWVDNRASVCVKLNWAEYSDA